jgi:L-rhamnose isomerase/sugar isomerase
MAGGTKVEWDELVLEDRRRHEEALQDDYDHLVRQLARRGIAIEPVLARAAAFTIALPSWGVATGGTRFARFPGPGEPRSVHEKLDDCSVIQRLVRITPEVSLHIPWDEPADPRALRAFAADGGLRFGPVNSNTFEDQPGQPQSYKFGSLSHIEAAVRDQAVAHNVHCIEVGEQLGAPALSVWVGDGGNFPGQQHVRRTLARYLDSLHRIYASLPQTWRLFIEHKLYEPAFYSTVLNDWGVSYYCASQLGDRAFALVDLGHQAPNVNVEMIVARLIQFGKLGGFHFNDSQYGDDDLDAGSLKPFQLFLVCNELVDAADEGVAGFSPVYMLDQSHNVTDPIESLMTSAIEVHRAYVQACLVDREALAACQARNDAVMALATLKQAFTTDVGPILARTRVEAGGALDPLAVYRQSGYRAHLAAERPAVARRGGGIV